MPCSLLAGVGLTLAYFWQVDTWVDLFSAIAAYGFLILVTLFFLYLNKDEKDMFLVPLKKILHLS